MVECSRSRTRARIAQALSSVSPLPPFDISDRRSPVISGTALVTGGAGFIGSHLAIALRSLGTRVLAFDSLRRSGSEFNVPQLREAGVDFIRGDVRIADDLLPL